jgi:hypothetical protein
MKNLTPLLTYVLGFDSSNTLIHSRLFKIELYARFLNQNLKDRYEVYDVIAHPMNRFIPCDTNGNIITPPSQEFMLSNSPEFSESEMQKYRQARSRVLFDGFEIKETSSSKYQNLTNGQFSLLFYYESNEWGLVESNLNIESLVIHKLKLTETAQRQIGVSPN